MRILSHDPAINLMNVSHVSNIFIIQRGGEEETRTTAISARSWFWNYGEFLFLAQIGLKILFFWTQKTWSWSEGAEILGWTFLQALVNTKVSNYFFIMWQRKSVHDCIVWINWLYRRKGIVPSEETFLWRNYTVRKCLEY